MTLRLKISPDLLIPANKAAEAARLGMSECVREHLRRRNETRPPSRYGLPKSNYWADAADSVTSEVSGNVAAVTVEQEGAALHYYGGTVHPKRGKALAIPIDPSVAGIWPSEANALTDHIAMIWPKNSTHGFLKDAETNELLWLLVPRATIPADPTVMPTDDEIVNAAMDAVLEAAS